MVLAAGRGTRLAPITDTTPKPLVPVAGRPFLEHILEFLHAGGIREVVVNLHHLGRLIAGHLGDGRRFGVEVHYSWEDPILDTGGGIKGAESLLGDESFVVVNGDSLLEVRLQDLIAHHEARGGIATMAVRADPDAARFGLVEVDAGSRVRRISGRPASAAGAPPFRGFMFPGLHILDPAIFDWMEPGQAFSITRVTYPALLAADEPVEAWVTAARWVNIDTPASLAAADAELRRRPFRY
jgi:NDP-sugar pyrophosphorylase family protein